MVEPLNTKPLTAADLVEMIAHKEQIGIWANEIATAISLGDMLKEDWSFDDSVDLEREIVAQLRDVLSSAFSHPAYDIATLITTQQQEIERLTSRNAVLDADGIAARKGAANNYARASAAESRVLSLEGALRNLAEAVDCEVDIGGKSGMFRERLTEARSALQRTGMGKLTKAQRHMLDACLETGGAWTTAVGCENDELLSGWVDRGWAERVDAPAGFHSLAAYRITDAGRQALSEGEQS